MATMTFDTLKLARKLEAAGFTNQQTAGAAEALAESLNQAVPDIATRTDLSLLEERLTARIAESKAEILKWMFGSLAAQAALIVALIKLLPS
jgi:hypothetical protein